MIVLDGMGRSGTSLLARLMAGMLEPQGWRYYYEPFHHPSPAGIYENWRAMIGRALLPADSDPEFKGYLEHLASTADGPLFWKEIRLALKQDWLLHQFPEMRIVHLTRDILGVWSSHRRPEAPDWMDRHRQIWRQCALEWSGQLDKLREKGVPNLHLLEGIGSRSDMEVQACIWSLNESFAWSLPKDRLRCIRYEDLCKTPILILEEIADLLKLSFGEEMKRAALDHFAESNEDRDPSGPGTGLPGEAMPEIWRSRLTPAEVRDILAIAGPTRTFLSYSRP